PHLTFERPRREVAGRIAVADLHVDHLENGAFPTLNVLDAKRAGPPALVHHLPPTVPPADLEQLPLAVVAVHAGHLVIVLANEELASRVPGVLEAGGALDDPHRDAVEGFLAKVSVLMLRYLIGRQVLVGELGAYEGIRLVRGSDSPAPSQRGQVQPLIVVAPTVLVCEESGSPHVRRVSEDQE